MVESELVAWCIRNVASLVGRENAIAGANSGFSQSCNIVRCHPQVQWAKLEALVEGGTTGVAGLWKRTSKAVSGCAMRMTSWRTRHLYR